MCRDNENKRRSDKSRLGKRRHNLAIISAFDATAPIRSSRLGLSRHRRRRISRSIDQLNYMAEYDCASYADARANENRTQTVGGPPATGIGRRDIFPGSHPTESRRHFPCNMITFCLLSCSFSREESSCPLLLLLLLASSSTQIANKTAAESFIKRPATRQTKGIDFLSSSLCRV